MHKSGSFPGHGLPEIGLTVPVDLPGHLKSPDAPAAFVKTQLGKGDLDFCGPAPVVYLGLRPPDGIPGGIFAPAVVGHVKVRFGSCNADEKYKAGLKIMVTVKYKGHHISIDLVPAGEAAHDAVRGGIECTDAYVYMVLIVHNLEPGLLGGSPVIVGFMHLEIAFPGDSVPGLLIEPAVYLRKERRFRKGIGFFGLNGILFRKRGHKKTTQHN